jgi:hypothetical protein
LPCQTFFNGGTRQFEEGPLRAGSVMGTVFRADGEPLPQARIHILGGDRKRVFQEVRSDSRGRFTLPRLAPGVYRMGISAENFHLHLWDLTIVKNGVSRNLTVRIRPSQ